MNQFFTYTDAQYDGLKERAKWACIKFDDQQMPSRCVPERARIGFEIDPDGTTAKLLVALGTRYDGQDSSVAGWLRDGCKDFETFESLRDWIRGPLASVFQSASVASAERSAVEDGHVVTSQLTDMGAVSDGLRDQCHAMYLDEERVYEELQNRVLGQKNALRVLASVMARHCARQSPARPAVLFAVGPSGVGKTRTAEILPDVLRQFADDHNGYQFLRLDMNEYQEAHRVSQLLGAPQGYAGHGEGSQLIDALRANSKTIVLFDEIEKAHPAILRVLMNAMDAGRLSTPTRSSSGREIDCKHSVFVFTSNLDAKDVLDELETREALGNREIEDEVCRRRLHAAGIAPEIVGRIGRFLVYIPLLPETRAKIVALSIAEVASEYGLNVQYVEPNVIVDLMKKVRSENFGVRPERFLIDDALGTAFAKTAAAGIDSPVRVCGEAPYQCEPVEAAEARDDSLEHAVESTPPLET
jgi:ATP-dependent Clp protease ATP-binding subunit ClpB